MRSIFLRDQILRFLRHRGGNVLLLFTLMSTLLVMSVGVAVDYMRAVEFRTVLQGTADAAALAGATAFTSCNASGDGSKATAQTIASNMFTSTSIPGSPGGITSSATGAVSGACPSPTAYNMTVSASATLPTTFLSIITTSMLVSVTATATNPVINATANAGDWFSSAWDGNYIYWYPIPTDGSVPSFDSTSMFDGSGNLNPTNGIFHFLFTNTPRQLSGGNPIPTSSPISVAASVKIGFLLHNVTGGRLTYGSGQYDGQTQGSIHNLYSQLPNPDASVITSNGSSNGGYTSNFDNTNNPHVNPNTCTPAPCQLTCTNNGAAYDCTKPQNCSLEIVTTTVDDLNNNVVPSQIQNKCYGVTTVSYSGQSCEQLGSQAVYYQWNDMGGGWDDYDYNDSEFGFYCSSGAGGPGVVHLTS